MLFRERNAKRKEAVEQVVKEINKQKFSDWKYRNVNDSHWCCNYKKKYSFNITNNTMLIEDLDYTVTLAEKNGFPQLTIAYMGDITRHVLSKETGKKSKKEKQPKEVEVIKYVDKTEQRVKKLIIEKRKEIDKVKEEYFAQYALVKSPITTDKYNAIIARIESEIELLSSTLQ